MATSARIWAVRPTSMTYSFKLTPGVLFHDGSRLTSADVEASYQRITHPPAGRCFRPSGGLRLDQRRSTRRIRSTLVFHLQWPEAAMLANFASPWNCIYSADKLRDDPQFPANPHSGHRCVRFRRACERRLLDRRALGPLLPAWQAIAGRLRGRLHELARPPSGHGERPCHGASAASPRPSATR